MSSYKEGQIHQLAEKMEKEVMTPDDVTILGQASSEIWTGIRGVLRGTHEIRLLKKKVVVKEAVDTIIHVDRSIQPAYPYWIKKIIHPELEKIGPTKYNISFVEQWLHYKQKGGGFVEGNVIYKCLKEADALKNHLGLADLLAIQAKGIAFFRKYFTGEAVFGWKLVVQHHDGKLAVPYLIGNGDKLIVCWLWLGLKWNSCSPALLFASSVIENY